MSVEEYLKVRDEQVKRNADDRDLHMLSDKYMNEWHRVNYVKGFTWMGIPVMQLPTDLMAMQEIIWKVKPDYVIETGVAFGGMTVFYASMIQCLENNGRVFGIDIELRQHTKDLVINHPLRRKFDFYEGSSIDKNIFTSLVSRMQYFRTKRDYTVLVSLDSKHTHDHVLQELRLYSPLVSLGSYIIIFDTSIETLDPKYIGDRPWGRGNSPGSAAKQFLSETDEFVVDTDIENRILLTSAPGGWLRRIKEAT